jgi:hypothetical protein
VKAKARSCPWPYVFPDEFHFMVKLRSTVSS